ncbi:acetate kinase, partial [Patescibacteria group bacterium]|nr:acetate kinase [Patescibacteria group bacterium]
ITRLQNYISLYASLLGSIQAIVFTGGIGERSSVIRQLAVQNLKIGKKTRVIKINADEELEIARQIRR